mmetsp:Transcript_106281/g.328133  ORF Transcript_106281/g.328133 Transcript_106281/m.328133 type:complete len:297 (-) Transcript_106281:1050-1940(-)
MHRGRGPRSRSSGPACQIVVVRVVPHRCARPCSRDGGPLWSSSLSRPTRAAGGQGRRHSGGRRVGRQRRAARGRRPAASQGVRRVEARCASLRLPSGGAAAGLRVRSHAHWRRCCWNEAGLLLQRHPPQRGEVPDLQCLVLRAGEQAPGRVEPLDGGHFIGVGLEPIGRCTLVRVEDDHGAAGKSCDDLPRGVRPGQGRRRARRGRHGADPPAPDAEVPGPHGPQGAALLLGHEDGARHRVIVQRRDFRGGLHVHAAALARGRLGVGDAADLPDGQGGQVPDDDLAVLQAGEEALL